MSRETLEWLNSNVLIGNTEVRGKAWHYQASAQGSEPNHYPRFIPVADVERRLFSFSPEENQAAFLVPAAHDATGSAVVTFGGKRFVVVADPEHKALVDPDDRHVFDYTTTDYAVHDYREWLLKNFSKILGDDLGITSAGLLRRRAQAWVEVSVPDVIETVEGVLFRPLLLAWTSLDRTFSTTYKRVINNTVCDNTLQVSQNEDGESYRVRHSKNSALRIGEAREALNIIYKASDDFQAEVRKQVAISVSKDQWQEILDALIPIKDKEKKSLSIAQNRREEIETLYTADERCAPWTGTKYGVIQTFNTWNFHCRTIRNTTGGGRVERNWAKVLGGDAARFDNLVASTVDTVVGV